MSYLCCQAGWFSDAPRAVIPNHALPGSSCKHLSNSQINKGWYVARDLKQSYQAAELSRIFFIAMSLNCRQSLSGLLRLDLQCLWSL